MRKPDSITTWPSVARIFVFLFTTLMLAVCGWAVFIYTVEKGEIDHENLPAYLAEETPDASAEVASDDDHEPESHLRHNLGLAHTHVNGQTLLFFALGAVFVFTSVKKRTKKIVLWTFGLSILVHAIGLSGEGFHWIFDDLLAISGVIMLVLIAYMCMMIYVDLGRKRETARG